MARKIKERKAKEKLRKKIKKPGHNSNGEYLPLVKVPTGYVARWSPDAKVKVGHTAFFTEGEVHG